MLVEIIDYRKFGIEIHTDDDPESPREWDNFGTIVCFHNRYNLGDDHGFDSPDELIDFVKSKDVICLSLYLYDHSGITMSVNPFNCQWDSGQVGYIFVTKEEIRKEFGVKRISKKLLGLVYTILKTEVEVYTSYLEGEVYGYVITYLNQDFGDSCFGIFRYDNCVKFGKEAVDDIMKEREICVGG